MLELRCNSQGASDFEACVCAEIENQEPGRVLLDLMRNVLHNLNSSERLTLLDEFENSRLH